MGETGLLQIMLTTPKRKRLLLEDKPGETNIEAC
jgi:hypothetical protein